MKYSLTLLVFAIGIVAGMAQDEHKRAFELYRQKQYADAIVLLEESIASHPDWYFPIMMKGYCNQKLDNKQEALRNFNDALTLEPPTAEIPKIKNAMATIYKQEKQYEKAIQAFTDLVEITPEDRHFDLLFNRGQCEMQIAQDDKNRAQSYFSKAVVSFSEALAKTTPRNDLMIEAAFQKAFAQYKIGNIQGGVSSLEKSIEAFQDVIRRNEREKRAHTFIINLQFQIVDKSKENQKVAAYNKAVGFIERYLKSWPDDLDMVDKKGKALQGARRYKDAIAVFQTVAMRRPNDGEVFFSIGSCQMADNQYTKAIDTFGKAAAKGMAADARVYSYTAHCYRQQKNACDGHDIPFQEQALDILEKGVKAVSGPAKQALEREVKSTRDNLDILRDRIKTDKDNHSAAISNVKALQATIEANNEKLLRNEEKNLQQPTQELADAIAAGRAAIDRDRKALAKEFASMEKMVAAAKKCGGATYYPSYQEMVSMLSSRS